MHGTSRVSALQCPPPPVPDADSNPRWPFRPYGARSIWAPRHMHRGAHSQVHPGAGCMGALAPRRPLTHVATGWPGVATRALGNLSNPPRCAQCAVQCHLHNVQVPSAPCMLQAPVHVRLARCRCPCPGTRACCSRADAPCARRCPVHVRRAPCRCPCPGTRACTACPGQVTRALGILHCPGRATCPSLCPVLIPRCNSLARWGLRSKSDLCMSP